MTHTRFFIRSVGGRGVRVSEQVQAAEATLLALVIFLIPLLFRHPQLVVGTAVNLALALGALHLGSWRRLAPLVVLPAIAALLGGVLFGSQITLGLMLLVPGIWAGNAVYVAGLWFWRRGSLRFGYLPTLAVVALAKTLVIGSVATILAGVGYLPWGLVQIFVPLQVSTAMIGGMLALPMDAALGRLLPR